MTLTGSFLRSLRCGGPGDDVDMGTDGEDMGMPTGGGEERGEAMGFMVGGMQSTEDAALRASLLSSPVPPSDRRPSIARRCHRPFRRRRDLPVSWGQAVDPRITSFPPHQRQGCMLSRFGKRATLRRIMHALYSEI